MISPSQRPLLDNTQHSQQTNIHAPGGIRTHNLSRRAAKDLRLRPRGHWDRHLYYFTQYYCFLALWPDAGYDLLIPVVSKSDTNTHHSRYDSSERVISSSQRPLPYNTHNSQLTNIHAPGGIRTYKSEQASGRRPTP